MNIGLQRARYNHSIPHMQSRGSGGTRLGWLTLLLASVLFPSTLPASTLTDTARQLAHKIAAITGPGAIALEIRNRSSLDDRAVNEVRTALEGQLHGEGVQTAKPDESVGAVQVVLSENMREYVWSAEIAMGQDQRRVVLVSLPHPVLSGTPASAMPLAIRKTFLLAQQQPILDALLVEMPGGTRLLALDAGKVSIYRQQAGHWELESSLPISHSRVFPRDLRGRLLLRHDHLFDAYLPGTVCRSSAVAPLALSCNDSDDPWPLTTEETGVRAFFASSRNFFTGTFSPGIGKISTAPSFYSAAALPRSGYTLWILSAVDGSLHLIDGMTDQVVRGVKWGSDIVSIQSNCGIGTQVLASESGDPEQDSLRAFEFPDRDPVAASAPAEFDGAIVTLWTESNGSTAMAIVKRGENGWYEAYRLSIACGD
jgi:hypothetical protein